MRRMISFIMALALVFGLACMANAEEFSTSDMTDEELKELYVKATIINLEQYLREKLADENGRAKVTIDTDEDIDVITIMIAKPSEDSSDYYDVAYGVMEYKITHIVTGEELEEPDDSAALIATFEGTIRADKIDF